MYRLFRHIIFLLDPEKAHHVAMGLMSFLVRIPGIKFLLKKIHLAKRNDPFELFGLTFKNRVGLGAGFDKDAKYLDVMEAMGFGHIEIGTVTPLPQAGNDKPRLFRLFKDSALINRMGFNNEGADAIAERLKKHQQRDYILGGNIGKNKTTPNDEAASDYLKCFKKLFDYVDYFTVNVSSPNTPNLRDLQDKDSLAIILDTLQKENKSKHNPKPILLKIAPDMSFEQIDEILSVVTNYKIDGIVATNTTVSREGLQTSEQEIQSIGAGGVSGKPLKEKSTAIVQYIYDKTNGALPIIAVGGIMRKQDAIDKFKSGAELVQLYTGFIYRGPHLVRMINKIKLSNKINQTEEKEKHY